MSRTICPWCQRTVSVYQPKSGGDPVIRSHNLETGVPFAARCPMSGAERRPEMTW